MEYGRKFEVQFQPWRYGEEAACSAGRWVFGAVTATAIIELPSQSSQGDMSASMLRIMRVVRVNVLNSCTATARDHVATSCSS
jgi:hypothetical protein